MTYSHPVYEFGDLRLDSVEEVLLRRGKPIHLTLKAYAVLRVLVENSGHVVTKDELMRQVWPNAFVEEANLAQAISVLRKALGESHQRHQNHKYIGTIARRGYRFDATVKVHDETSGTRQLTAKSSEVAESSKRYTSDSRRLAKRYTEGDATHHLYLRGRYYWGKYTIDGLKKGIEQFRQAIKLDPNFALAQVGLADCYYRLSNVHLHPRLAMPKAKRAVLEALKLDETMAEAHTLLGLIRMFYDRDWATAETEFKRAIALAPGSALAHKRYGWALGMLGQFDESITALNLALELEPHSADLHVGLGIIFHLARVPDAAITQAQLALDILPDFFPAHVLAGIAHVQRSQLTEALAALQKAALLADVPWTLGYLGYAYAISAKRRQGLRVLAELAKRSKQAYVSPYALALVHTGLGQNEQALRFVESTCDDRNQMLGFVRSSPELDGLRSDQRFAALLNRSGFSAVAA